MLRHGIASVYGVLGSSSFSSFGISITIPTGTGSTYTPITVFNNFTISMLSNIFSFLYDSHCDWGQIWNFNAVLICIFLVAKDNEHFFKMHSSSILSIYLKSVFGSVGHSLIGLFGLINISDVSCGLLEDLHLKLCK